MRASVLAAATLTALVAATTPTAGTQAAWNNTAAATGSLNSYVVAAPANFTCTRANTTTLRFSWTPASDATGYTIFFRIGSTGGTQQATFASTTTSVTFQNPSNTQPESIYIVTNRTFTSTTWQSQPSTTRTYRQPTNGQPICVA